jgi:hypothetical protein
LDPFKTEQPEKIPPISLKNLARFMTAKPARQRKILLDLKYPDPEGIAQALYYEKAITAIESFHRGKRPLDWLDAQADDLLVQAQEADVPEMRAVKLRSNARAIRDYRRSQLTRHLDVRPMLKLHMAFEGILVTMTPDLHVLDKRKTKLIKIDCTGEAANEEIVKICTQGFFMGARHHDVDIASSQIRYWHISTGEDYKGARMGARLSEDIRSACMAIKAIWPTIEPPIAKPTFERFLRLPFTIRQEPDRKMSPSPPEGKSA